MKSFRRPSPALVISLIALFVSLSGVSYGVATGFIDSREIKNNQVRSKDLRNNDVRTRDLRNNEVRGIDIRNSTVRSPEVGLNSLTGNDINESRLGKVPSAAAADTATSATTAASAQNVRAIAPTGLARGATPVTLATHGPLRVVLSCTAGTTATTASIGVSSSADNSSALGPAATPGDPDLDAADPPIEVLEVEDTAATVGRSGESGGMVASTAAGQAVSGQLSVLADQDAATCSAQGHLVTAG